MENDFNYSPKAINIGLDSGYDLLTTFYNKCDLTVDLKNAIRNIKATLDKISEDNDNAKLALNFPELFSSGSTLSKLFKDGVNNISKVLDIKTNLDAIEKLHYPSVEAAFKAMSFKYLNLNLNTTTTLKLTVDNFLTSYKLPAEVKSWGQTLILNLSEYDNESLLNMLLCNYNKFNESVDCKNLLLGTGHCILIYALRSGESKWSSGNSNDNKNYIGRMLMLIRSIMRGNQVFNTNNLKEYIDIIELKQTENLNDLLGNLGIDFVLNLYKKYEGDSNSSWDDILLSDYTRYKDRLDSLYNFNSKSTSKKKQSEVTTTDSTEDDENYLD